MDLKTQLIQEYLTQGCGFRKLAARYGISRTTICSLCWYPEANRNAVGMQHRSISVSVPTTQRTATNQ